MRANRSSPLPTLAALFPITRRALIIQIVRVKKTKAKSPNKIADRQLQANASVSLRNHFHEKTEGTPFKWTFFQRLNLYVNYDNMYVNYDNMYVSYVNLRNVVLHREVIRSYTNRAFNKVVLSRIMLGTQPREV